MKLAMQMTFDGMVRALRLRAHQVGEDRQETERRNSARRNRQALTLLSDEWRRQIREADDERGR